MARSSSFSKAVEAATAPHQCAMSTRVGTEYVVRLTHKWVYTTQLERCHVGSVVVCMFVFSRCVWEDEFEEVGDAHALDRSVTTSCRLGQALGPIFSAWASFT